MFKKCRRYRWKYVNFGSEFDNWVNLLYSFKEAVDQSKALFVSSFKKKLEGSIIDVWDGKNLMMVQSVKQEVCFKEVWEGEGGGEGRKVLLRETIYDTTKVMNAHKDGIWNKTWNSFQLIIKRSKNEVVCCQNVAVKLLVEFGSFCSKKSSLWYYHHMVL